MFACNFFVTFLGSFIGLAWVTRPRRSGLLGCCDQMCCPQQREEDNMSKISAFAGIALEWLLAVGCLLLIVFPLLFLGSQGAANLLLTPIVLFFLGLPFFAMSVLAAVFFGYFFWVHGRNFAVIPWWIYLLCVPSVFAWIVAGVLAMLVCMQSNGMNIWGSGYYSQQAYARQVDPVVVQGSFAPAQPNYQQQPPAAQPLSGNRF